MHITLCGSADFMTTVRCDFRFLNDLLILFRFQIFPSWPLNDAESIAFSTTPLIMQSELTGLLSLCKLEVRFSLRISLRLADRSAKQSAHASKVHERPYFNIVTLLQKVRRDSSRSKSLLIHFVSSPGTDRISTTASKSYDSIIPLSVRPRSFPVEQRLTRVNSCG